MLIKIEISKPHRIIIKSYNKLL